MPGGSYPGKAPGILMLLGRDPEPSLGRAALVQSQARAVYLARIGPVASSPEATVPVEEPISIEILVARHPDGFVVIDGHGA